MKHVLGLSDTHGLLQPEVLEYLSQADIIIHSGDINTQAIVDKLREYAPLYIVRHVLDKVTVLDGGHLPVTFRGGAVVEQVF